MKISILDVKINQIKFDEVLAAIDGFLTTNSTNSAAGQNLIVTINPEYVVAAQNNLEFKNILNQAAIATCDGAGLVWAAKFLFKQELYRATGVDLSRALMEKYVSDRGRIYLLGGQENVAALVAQKYPQANIVGFESGGWLDEVTGELQNNPDIVKRINDSQANLLLAAFGQVKAEKWLAKYLPQMPGVKVAISVGGTFDYLSGQIKRAPTWLRNMDLEWLYRLIRQPQRYKRIYNATIKFTLLVLKQKIYGHPTGEKN